MIRWPLDDSVIEAYIKGFYGQGRYQAPYWFIGMEFGGGTSVDEIVSRIGIRGESVVITEKNLAKRWVDP